MNKAQLISLFGMGCAVNSLICWLASIHPKAYKFAMVVYVFTIVGLIVGLVLDDGIYPNLGLNQFTYYVLLGIIALTIIFGTGLIWLTV